MPLLPKKKKRKVVRRSFTVSATPSECVSIVAQRYKKKIGDAILSSSLSDCMNGTRDSWKTFADIRKGKRGSVKSFRTQVVRAIFKKLKVGALAHQDIDGGVRVFLETNLVKE